MNNFKTFLLLSFVLPTALLLAQTTKEHTIHNSFAPFLREGDRPLLIFTLQNKQQSDWTGSVSLSLQDGDAKQSVDGWFMNSIANQYFTVDAKSQYPVLFPIEVPFFYNQSLNWKLAVESPEDSMIKQGSLSILSWPYEDSVNSPIVTEFISAIEKKVYASDVIQQGQKILIEISFELTKKIDTLQVKDEWAAGLALEKGSIQVSGILNKYFVENNTLQSLSLKFTTLSPGKYTLRYQAVATNPGVYNQPPTLLFLNSATSYSARSAYQKITIE